jgi:hypothetical protein
MAAVAMRPTLPVAVAYFGFYALLRAAIALVIGAKGLKQHIPWKKLALIPVWDAMAFVIWFISFGRNSVRWRDIDYQIRDGMLEPITPPAQD